MKFKLFADFRSSLFGKHFPFGLAHLNEYKHEHELHNTQKIQR